MYESRSAINFIGMCWVTRPSGIFISCLSSAFFETKWISFSWYCVDKSFSLCQPPAFFLLYESLLSQRLLHSVIVILPKKSLVKISGATLFFKYNYLSVYEKPYGLLILFTLFLVSYLSWSVLTFLDPWHNIFCWLICWNILEEIRRIMEAEIRHLRRRDINGNTHILLVAFRY